MTDKISAGALRAAKVFWDKMVNPGNEIVVDDLARIIDTETGLGELIESLEYIIECVDGGMDHKIKFVARTALARVQGKD